MSEHLPPNADLPVLDAARWIEIRRLLNEVRDRPPSERAAFLDTIDGALRAEVEALLTADAAASSGGFLDAPAAARAPALFDGAADAYVGRMAGPWRLEERLGEGGMGVVYRAAREGADFEQQAALKLVGRGLVSRAHVERFRQERRILARLEHPNIARFLDGGVTEDGQPYFAMEIVRGEPLTHFADRRHLGVQARVGLFLAVCEGVAHAHRMLVVHRDLKPSNVVVAEDASGRPAVKLLDFGIAKLLSEEDEAMPLTRTGALMTPAYAAPEQVRGEPVTTATDVYALGMLLFELLAGQRPYDVAPGASPTTVERVVCETDPPPPSAVAVPARARRLRGDLDIITLKALEKEPARRYASADALAADLRRHLDGLPITARRATTGYRVRAFVRRHPVGVGLSSLALLALLIGMAGTAWQARVAAAERDRAQLEARKAEEIRDYVVGLFAVADPDSTQGREVTVRELLDTGAARVALDLAGQPLVRADMSLTMAQLYRRLGLYDEARPHVEAAIALREAHVGSRAAETATARRELAFLLTEAGDYSGSREAARRAYDDHRAALGPDDAETLASLNTLASAYAELGELAEADSAFTRLVARHRAASDSAALGETLLNLGSVRIRQQRFEQAEDPLREAVALRRALYGDVHSAVATALNSLGLAVARGRGDLDEAERFLQEALAIRRRLYGDRHPEVAQMLNNLARLHEEQGNLTAAQAAYEELVPLVQQVLGAEHPNTGLVLANYGLLFLRRGRPEAAEPLLRRALAIHRAALGADHPATAETEADLARVLVALGRRAEARRLVAHALPVLEAAYGSEAPPVQKIREVEAALE